MTNNEGRILIVSPSFFGYEKSIQQAFANEGACDVDLHDERPSNGSVQRALVRIAPALLSRSIKQHFLQILSQTARHHYKLIVVIKGEVTPLWFLQTLRDRNPQAVFVFYSFDSIDNSSQCRTIFPAFDYLFSFDRRDVANHRELQYKPLFYSEEFQLPHHESRTYDLSFVGTVHSNRYKFVKSVAQQVSTDRQFFFFYVQASWYFWINKIGPFRGIPRTAVNFESISREDVARVFGASRAVIDVQRKGQAGLTMRTFEVLASGAALVTTNTHIRSEDFFDESRILVLDDDQGTADRVRQFIEELQPASQDDRSMAPYSLQAWVRSYLDLKPNRANIGSNL